MALGPMSTPRRPEPRSSAAPMMVAFRRGCIDIAEKANVRRMGNPETAAMIRVLLADDDQPFLEALSPLIERQPELRVVGTAGDGLAAIELADELAPDAVVIDLHMPRLDGVTAVARLRRDHPSMCVIALTGDEHPALHQAVTDAGADAVLVKEEFVDVLVDRLAAAARGSDEP